jgi:hypothetical protein
LSHTADLYQARDLEPIESVGESAGERRQKHHRQHLGERDRADPGVGLGQYR